MPHAEILDEIASIQDPAIVGTQLPADDALIAREQAIAAAIFAGADTRCGGDGAAGLLTSPAEARAALEAPIGPSAAPWRAPVAETLAATLHLTPSLRFNELYGPRNYAPAVLARIWLAWIGFAALGEALAQRVLGLQELTTMWSEQAHR